MSIFPVGLLAIVCCLLPGSAFAQQDIEILPLADGSFIRFERFGGALLRLKEGRQVARVKLPRATMIERRTDVVMSKDESRLLVVHGDSPYHYPPRHRVAILDSMSLRTIAQLPLGDCSFLDLRPLPEHVTMLCQQSQDPGDKKKKKTFALVTLDLNRARVTRWFDLGGERRGDWFGPMFFGYHDLTLALEVTTEGCGTVHASEAKSLTTVDASEHPAHIIVLIRKAGLRPSDGPTTGEVWFVGSGITDAPRRVKTLSEEAKDGKALRRSTARDRRIRRRPPQAPEGLRMRVNTDACHGVASTYNPRF